MPYGNLTLEELARHLGLDARELLRWAERGRLPGLMVGGKWRFNRAQMLDWAQAELHRFSAEELRNLERAMSSGADDRLIGNLLPPDGVDMLLPARSATSVLRELVKLAEKTGLLWDPDALLDALQQREELRSTALAGGLALPHPRRPLEHAYAEPFICVARVPAGVPFSAPDGRMTDVFVLVCCQDERQHLNALARVTRMFHKTPLADQLRSTTDRADAVALLLEAEAASERG